jgi:hypothetical protein
MLASSIAWVIGVALTVGVFGVLLWLLRVILRDSAGKPRRRALMLFAFAFGLFVLWSVSQVVP